MSTYCIHRGSGAEELVQLARAAVAASPASLRVAVDAETSVVGGEEGGPGRFWKVLS